MVLPDSFHLKTKDKIISHWTIGRQIVFKWWKPLLEYRHETSATVEGAVFLNQPLRTVHFILTPKHILNLTMKYHNKPW